MDSLLTHKNPEIRKIVKQVIVHKRRRFSVARNRRVTQDFLNAIIRLNYPLVLMGDTLFDQTGLKEITADIICTGVLSFKNCKDFERISGNIIAGGLLVKDCPRLKEITGTFEADKESAIINCPKLKVLPKVLNGVIKLRLEEENQLKEDLFENIGKVIKQTLSQAGYKNLEELDTYSKEMLSSYYNLYLTSRISIGDI